MKRMLRLAAAAALLPLPGTSPTAAHTFEGALTAYHSLLGSTAQYAAAKVRLTVAPFMGIDTPRPIAPDLSPEEIARIIGGGIHFSTPGLSDDPEVRWEYLYDSPALETSSVGFGFRVTTDGYILTSASLVDGCTELLVSQSGPVSVVARDSVSRLALLKGPPAGQFARFREGSGVRKHASVFAVANPEAAKLASEPKVTAGSVAALAGLDGDRRFMLIAASDQFGNGGGPVMDQAGNIVGMAVPEPGAVKMALATGDISRNVNPVLSAYEVRAFLDAESIMYATAFSDEELTPDEVAAAAKSFHRDH